MIQDQHIIHLILQKDLKYQLLHVNADCPESVIATAAFAFEYRQKFGKDIVIDLLGYRQIWT